MIKPLDPEKGERRTGIAGVRQLRVALLSKQWLCLFAALAAGCTAPSQPKFPRFAVSPPVPPLPFHEALRNELQTPQTEPEPVGYTLSPANVRTNPVGHVEFRFFTQTFWQGWEIQQSDDGLVWQTFASTTVTNGDWQSTNFVVVNGSPGIYPERKYRLLRLK